MYKCRFKKWGLAKKLRRQDVMEIRVQARSGNKFSLPTVHGREIGSKQFQQQLQRDYLAAASRPRQLAPSPLLYNSPAPMPLAHIENAMRACAEYTRLLFEPDVGDVPNHNDDCSRTLWWMTAMSAIRALKQRRGSRDAFRLLGCCYDRYGDLLVRHDPLLITTTLSIALRLNEVGSELAASLLGYVSRLTAIRFGVQHPFSIFWYSLHALGAPELRKAVVTLQQAHFDSIKRHLQPGQCFRTLCQSHARRQVGTLRNLPVEVIKGRPLGGVLEETLSKEVFGEDDAAVVTWIRNLQSHFGNNPCACG